MSPHHIEELFGLLALVALLAWGARVAGLPYPIVLVLGGLGLGSIPGLPAPHVDPQVVFLVFLPPLVHAAAYTTSPRRLRESAPAIGLLSLGLVGVTIAVVAVVAHGLVAGMPWAAAVALGAIVAPTDVVAATSIFRRLGVPERVVGLVEGESLVNDGSGLVAYRIAVVAVTSGTFSVLDGVRDLVAVSAGGVAIGVAVAWLAAQLRRRLDDSLIEITITLLTPYVAYIGAEEAGVSGVLAAVTCGVILGRRARDLFSPGTRLEANAFWAVLTFLLESLLFILLGLQFPNIVSSVPGSLVAAAVLIPVAVCVVRMLWVLALTPGSPVRERVIVGWTGMRGAVSLAAALALPTTVDGGGPFPARAEILFLTLVVIGATLLLQGLTLPLVIKAAVLEEREPGPRRRALARFGAVEAVLSRIGELSVDGDVPAASVERARELYTQRASQLAGECRTGVAEEDTDTAAWLRLRLDLLAVERGALVDMRDRGEISQQVLLDIERDLDLEASRIGSRLAAA